jgi:hypothetical protein
MALTVPAIPARLAAAGFRQASGRIGPEAAGVILLVAAAGGVWRCRQQPEERREQIKGAPAAVGKHYLDRHAAASSEVLQARAALSGCLIPGPEQRSRVSAILRELATAPQSLSAQQLAVRLDESVRPKVADLRAFLRTNNAIFSEVRRGGYALGLNQDCKTYCSRHLILS